MVASLSRVDEQGIRVAGTRLTTGRTLVAMLLLRLESAECGVMIDAQLKGNHP